MSNPDETRLPENDRIKDLIPIHEIAAMMNSGDYSAEMLLQHLCMHWNRRDGWLAIESAPKWADVLVWRKDAGVFVAKVATPECVMTDHQLEVTPFPDGFEEWWSDHWGWLEGEMKPTHWRPLPEPPKENAQAMASADTQTPTTPTNDQ